MERLGAEPDEVKAADPYLLPVRAPFLLPHSILFCFFDPLDLPYSCLEYAPGTSGALPEGAGETARTRCSDLEAGSSSRWSTPPALEPL